MTPNPEIGQILQSGEAHAPRTAYSTTTSAPASELKIDAQDAEARDEASFSQRGAAIVPTDVSLVAPTHPSAGLATKHVNFANGVGDAPSFRPPSVLKMGIVTPFDPRAAHGVLFGEKSGSRVDLDGDDLIIVKETRIAGPVG